MLQPKLALSSPGDPFEREADAVADRVMGMAGPAAAPMRITPIIQRQEGPEPDDKDDDELAQREPAGTGKSAPRGSFDSAIARRAGGSPLPGGARGFFESRLGHDLGHVRIHNDAHASGLARQIDARAFTLGPDIYFASGEFDAGSAAGRRLLAHELAHVIQQGSAPRSIQRLCSPAATCAAPIPGDPTEFGIDEERREKGPRDRRKAMTPDRARATGHAGRARQLETILNAHDPALRAMVHGIFIDHDMSSNTEAMLANCARWRTDGLPAGDPDPDGFVGAANRCIFVHGILNQQALAFNKGDAVVGGRARNLWHTDTIITLTHEVQHQRFDTITEPALVRPAGVTSATCTKAAVAHNLSEMVSIISEFPLRFNDAQAEASPTGPAHVRLNNYFAGAVSNPAESLEGALTKMGCLCNCPEIDLFVIQAVNASTTGFTAPQKTALRTELRTRMPGPGRPLWPMTPV